MPRLVALDAVCFSAADAYPAGLMHSYLLQPASGGIAAVYAEPASDAVAAVHHQPASDGVAAVHHQPASDGVAAVHHQKIAAFVLMDWSDAQSGHVVTLDVDPQHRRQGLGRLLMEAAHEHFEQHGKRHAALEVDADNRAAIALYRGLGYRIAERFREGRKSRYFMVMELLGR